MGNIAAYVEQLEQVRSNICKQVVQLNQNFYSAVVLGCITCRGCPPLIEVYGCYCRSAIDNVFIVENV